jgi:hypothetical protein
MVLVSNIAKIGIVWKNSQKEYVNNPNNFSN